MIVALAVTAVSLTGCQSGLSAGEGPGIKAIVDGELNGNVAAPLESATEALLQVLMQMGVLNVDQERDALVTAIHARTLEEVPLEIKLSRVSDDLTKLRIRAGRGDEAVARDIYNRVRSRLAVM